MSLRDWYLDVAKNSWEALKYVAGLSWNSGILWYFDLLNGTDSCLTLNGYFTIFYTAYELPLPAEPAVLDFESLIMLPS